jgi:cytidine deaminase
LANTSDPLKATIDAAELLARASEAAERAYAPYSGFRVGAALLDGAGRVHTGANVENASYGLATCAERVALTGAVASGSRSFVAIAVASTDERGPLYPCGACRQILHEFAPAIEVIVACDTGPCVVPLGALLPKPFDASALADSGDGADD